MRTEALDSSPHEFSGGPPERIEIARGLRLGTRLMICRKLVLARARAFLSFCRPRPRGGRRHDRALHPPAAPLLRGAVVGVPIPEPEVPRKRIILKGDVPSPINLPSG